MADEKNLVSMAQQFTGLPMDDLIGGPLNAAARANNAMALTQTNFMLSTCFSRTETGYNPIMIDMTLKRGLIAPGATVADPPTIETVDTTFRLPILTIIPLNSLAVDSVDINFEMEVKSSYGEESSTESQQEVAASAEWEMKLSIGPFSASVKGNASYKSTDSSKASSHYEKSNQAKYTVAVHAGQLPLPPGVTTIIDVFSKSIDPIQMPTSEAA